MFPPAPLLEKDCAVCKEQFALGTEDPDEQIIVTLPCKHPFHEPCIMPWLKSSGTCPVCRYQLVPQPSNHAPGPGPPSGSGSGDNPNPSSSRPGSPRAPGSFGGSGERRNDGAQGQQGGGGPAGILGQGASRAHVPTCVHLVIPRLCFNNICLFFHYIMLFQA